MTSGLSVRTYCLFKNKDILSLYQLGLGYLGCVCKVIDIPFQVEFMSSQPRTFVDLQKLSDVLCCAVLCCAVLCCVALKLNFDVCCFWLCVVFCVWCCLSVCVGGLLWSQGGLSVGDLACFLVRLLSGVFSLMV